MAIDTLGANALASDSVTTAKIVDDAVTSAKIPAGAVVVGDIADGSISTAKLADDAVTSAKVADDAITGAMLANDIAISTTGNIATTGSGTITSAGLMTASGSVAIGGTGTANTLDDYEEGTWTPTWGVASGTIGTWDNLNTGRYTKVGRLVHIQGYISYGSNSSASGVVSVHGLPFTSTNSGFGQSSNQSGGITCVANALWTSDCPEAGRVPANSTNFTPVISISTGTRQIEFNDFGTNANWSQLVFFGTYIVNT